MHTVKYWDSKLYHLRFTRWLSGYRVLKIVKETNHGKDL